MKNKLHLDYANNPDLAEAFSRKKAGDKCTFEVTIQVDDVDDKRVTGTIEKVTLEASGDEKKDKEAEPTPEEPMMMEMNVGSKTATTRKGSSY